MLAFDELELASLTATAPGLRRRVGMALNYARGLAADEGPRERRSERRGLIDLRFPR